MKGVFLIAVAGFPSACATVPLADILSSTVGTMPVVCRVRGGPRPLRLAGWLQRNAQPANEVVFYEAMRMERNAGTPDVLVVTGMADDTVRFTRDMSVTTAHRFVNAHHDYPQVITFRPGDGRLDAGISALNGSNQMSFLKAACTAP